MLWMSTMALAHMAMEQPLPRYPSDGSADNKACPCGVGASNRLCDVPSDRSDPDRSVYVTTYAPGETITLTWRETIGHAGRWRVAFDGDGADMDDFNQTILLDIPDPAGTAGNTGNGDLWEVQVTLPNTPCDNCTLQLVQIMDGNTTDPVPDPIGRSSYYQCADIEIAGGPVDTDDTDSPVDTDDTDSPVDTDVPVDQANTCGCVASVGGPAGLPVFAPFLLAWCRRR
mgnify:FL=1